VELIDRGTWSTLPSYAFYNNNGTGFGNPDANVISFTSNSQQISRMGIFDSSWSWTVTTSGTTANIRTITYAAPLGLYVLAGASGITRTSTDGVNWTAQTSGTTNSISQVKYLNGQFVMLAGNQVRTSANGISWTLRYTDSSTLNGVTFGDGVFVVVGTSGRILTTTDLTSYTVRTSATTETLNSVEFANGVFVAVGTTGTIRRSTNTGTTWSTITALSATITSVTFGNNTWVAVGNLGLAATSADGITWSSANPLSGTQQAVTFGNGQFVSVGQSGNVRISANGVTWSVTTSGTSLELFAITYGNNTWLYGGTSGVLARSQGFTNSGMVFGDTNSLIPGVNNNQVGLTLSPNGIMHVSGAGSTGHTLNVNRTENTGLIQRWSTQGTDVALMDTSGTFTANLIFVRAQGGTEGGEIQLARAPSGSTLAGNLLIDTTSNRLRIFESDSPNKGAFLDISGCASNVGSQLIHSGNINQFVTPTPPFNGGTITDDLTISKTLPTLALSNTSSGSRSAFFRCSGDILSVHGGAASSTIPNWTTTPLQINLNNNVSTFGGPVKVPNSGNSTGAETGIDLSAAGNGYLFGTFSDAASATEANVKLASWLGIGFAPSISDPSVPIPIWQNAVWIDVRQGNLFARGNIVAYASDARLKTNFVNISHAVDKVNQLNGYEFDWLTQKCFDLGFAPMNTHEHGFKAQEVQQVVPDAVTIAPFDHAGDNKSASGEHYLTVRYEKLVPLLVEAIKELHVRIKQLEAQ
jgi:hypothetical protein